jgi:H+-transporting ATPase
MQTPDATASAAPTIAETLAKLEADDKTGLTDAEVQPNALVEQQRNAFAALVAYFWRPISWMIEAGALMAIIVGAWGDFTIITSLLLFYALLGFWEEHEASNALNALKGSRALKARALRNGGWQQIDARTLVPGAIVRLYLGDVVPADCNSLRAITSASTNLR